METLTPSEKTHFTLLIKYKIHESLSTDIEASYYGQVIKDPQIKSSGIFRFLDMFSLIGKDGPLIPFLCI